MWQLDLVKSCGYFVDLYVDRIQYNSPKVVTILYQRVINVTIVEGYSTARSTRSNSVDVDVRRCWKEVTLGFISISVKIFLWNTVENRKRRKYEI